MKGNIGIFSTLGALAVGASLVTIPAAASASVTSKSTPNLSGYTLNVGDISNQLELQLVESGEITPLSSGSSTFTVKGFPFQVSFTQFPAGPEVLAGIEGGSLQFGVTTDTAMIFAQQAGLPIKTVAVTIPQKPGALFSIVTSAKFGISSVAGLKGKTVAVQTGTVNEYLLLSALEKAKLKYTQVTEDNLTSPNGLAALKNGAVDAAVLQEPYVSLAKLAGYKVITSGAGYVQGYQALDAPTSALNDPKTSAAIGDFLTLLDGAEVWNKSHSAQAIIAGSKLSTIFGVKSGAKARRCARHSSPSAVKSPLPRPGDRTRNCKASLR